MESTRTQLLDALATIAGVPVLVVGDLIVDRYVWGAVDRVSAEAPVPVVDVRKTEARLGGAGNVARNLKTLGAEPIICGVIGDDDDGREMLRLLQEEFIPQDGVLVDRSRPTSVKTRIIAQRQQIVRIDRERRAPLDLGQREAFAALVDAHIDPAKSIVLSDYGKGAVNDTLMKRFLDAAAKGRITFPGRALMVDPHPTNYAVYQSINIAKPNRAEAERASGIAITDRDSALQAAQALEKRWATNLVIITLGEDGLLMYEPGKPPLFLPTIMREVYDVSGAGDTVTAVLSAALAAGIELKVAGDLANLAAGVAVSEVGTVAVSRDELETEIKLRTI